MSAKKLEPGAPGSSTAPAVYRYARFSSAGQADGMSLERQADAAAAWAAQRGLTIDDSYSAVDEGVSASKGKNLVKALGAILTAVKAGDIAPGSTLLVESTSRLTRLVPRLARQIVERLVGAGVNVTFLDTGYTYNRETIDQLGHDVVFSVNASSASNYAKDLQRYGRAAWEKRRKEMANGAAVTRMLPFWLSCDKDKSGKRGAIYVNKHGETVARMFAEYLAGRGKVQIANRLNAEKVAAPDGASQWFHGTVGRTLANRATFGEFQSHVEVPTPYVSTLEDLIAALQRKRAKVGEPVAGYYPAVVDRETFDKAATMRERNRAKAGSTINSGRAEVSSLFSRLAKCPACGGAMKREAGRSPRYVCSKAISGKSGACKRVYVRVADVERALLANVDAIGVAAPGPDPKVNNERGELAGKLATVTANLSKLSDRIVAMVMNGEEVSSAMNAAHTKLEHERDELAASVEKLERAAGAAQGSAIKRRVEYMVNALKNYAAQLSTVAETNAALYECFDSVVIDYAAGELRFNWRHGPPPAVVPYTAG